MSPYKHAKIYDRADCARVRVRVRLWDAQSDNLLSLMPSVFCPADYRSSVRVGQHICPSFAHGRGSVMRVHSVTRIV